MVPEADMSWKWSDLWDDGWETAACVGSDCFICTSVVLAECPTAHFWAALRTFGPTNPAKIAVVHWRFLPGVFLSLMRPCQSRFSLPKCTLSADIWILFTFCCEGAGGTAQGEDYLGNLWNAERICNIHGAQYLWEFFLWAMKVR